MYQNASDAYLETRVLSADPLELVRMLYQAATSAVQDARRQLAAGEIAARSRSITKAWEVLFELTSALDGERGGELAGRLAQLYTYMQSRLIEANTRQEDAPLAEVLGLLVTIAEGWEALGATSKPPAREDSPWGQPAPPELAGVGAYASHAWSF